jgi:hypothetical protein
MFNLKDLLGPILSFKKGKAEEITLTDKKRQSPRYGDELLCARYYNEEETDYIDLYIPKKGPLGILMSGGADSSLLAFLLAKTIKDYNLDVKILPISFKRDNKPWNLWVATYVIENIENILDIKKGEIFLNHNYCYFGNHEKPEFHKNLEIHFKTLKDKNLVTMLYNGMTKNPDPIPSELEDQRETKRDNPIERINNLPQESREEFIISMPFIFQDKSFIANLYKKHDLLNSLFPYTRSCEGFLDKTDFYRSSCEKCWWCRERTWAFSKYTLEPLKHISAPEKLKRTCVAI